MTECSVEVSQGETQLRVPKKNVLGKDPLLLKQPTNQEGLPENYPYKSFIDYNGDVVNPTGIPVVDTSNKAKDEFIRAAFIDEMTGFFNKNAYINFIKNLNPEEGHLASIIICDINGLKEMNDNQGHSFGNQLIQHTADLIKEIFPRKKKDSKSQEKSLDTPKNQSEGNEYNTMIARIGGDEFVIIVMGLKTPEEQKKLKDYVKGRFSHQNQSDAKADFSYGIAHFNHNQDQAIDVIDREEGKNYGTTFDQADAVMYKHKTSWKAKNPGKYPSRP